MSQLSLEQAEMARKNYAQILRRLASVGNGPVARAVDCDEATISRMKPEKFQQFADILAVLDLKIVPSEMKCFNEKTIEVLLYGHRQWVEHVQGVDQLEFD